MWHRIPLLVRAFLLAAAVTGSATVIWGVLVQAKYFGGSILPAIVLHSLADAIEFIAAWKIPRLTPTSLGWESGPDRLLWLYRVLVLLLGGLSIWAFARLARTVPNPPRRAKE